MSADTTVAYCACGGSLESAWRQIEFGLPS
jgi:hypothetical protein